MSGLVTMTPTSIDHVGTSASINANGGVDFEGVTSLSLDGVFTGEFDNYVVMITTGDTGGADLDSFYRLRASGVDATGSNYTTQTLIAANTNVLASRTEGSTSGHFASFAQLAPNGSTVYFYGPALAQPTAHRCVNATEQGGARITDAATTHSESSSYDGVTIYVSSDSLTGNLIVMGYAE